MDKIIIKAVDDSKRTASELFNNLHADDKRELYALGLNDSEARLYLYITISRAKEAFAAYNEQGELLNVMGIGKEKSALGVPIWSLKTEGQRRYKREFVYYGRRYIEGVLEREKKVYNLIHSENKSSLRFIKSCGAVFDEETKDYGRRGEPFRPFTLTKEGFRCALTR